MIVSKVSSKGQITIPKSIREVLKVGTSDRIVFSPYEDGRVLIIKEKHSPRSLFGMFKHRKRLKPVSQKEMDAVIRRMRLKRRIGSL